ncbi:MOSC domain-containing protein [Leptolyngbya sp. AN02str]|uniref:MOSC domain-containing protein n=1 Tax=Leptolyngbya sp. AN02str TaxID=3423363 RepID=UPI003D3192C5
MPHLAHIWIYPIKSLDGVERSQVSLLPGGALAGDREFALFDAAGRVVNAKRTEAVHHIRAQFDLPNRVVTLSTKTLTPQSFHLDGDRPALEHWLSSYFGESITLQQNTHMGFPDDTHASGPTVVSTATLETVASWFPGMTVDEARQRFRTNLEIGNVPAFWEDEQFTPTGAPIALQVGSAMLMSCNPCQRCIVPTRHPQTGDRIPQFQALFAAQRQATLPTQAPTSRFNHFYKLTLNTQVAATEAGKILAIGDNVQSMPGHSY